MAQPRKQKEICDRIEYKRKFTDRRKVSLIKKLADEWVLTEIEVLDKLITDGLAKERVRLQSS